MFGENTFLPLPTWVKSDDVVIPIEPFKERLEEIEAFIKKELRKPAKNRSTVANFLRQ